MKKLDEKKIKEIPHPIVYGIYTKLIETTKHYAFLRLQYTQLAFTLMIATFLGIEIVLSGLRDFPISQLVLLLFMFSAGTVGIILLWSLDFISADKFIQSATLELIKLEKRYQWLPNVHVNMVSIFSKGTGHLKSYIYVVFCFILLVFSSFNAYFILANQENDSFHYFIFGFSIFILLLTLYLSKGSVDVIVYPKIQTIKNKFMNKN